MFTPNRPGIMEYTVKISEINSDVFKHENSLTQIMLGTS